MAEKRCFCLRLLLSVFIFGLCVLAVPLSYSYTYDCIYGDCGYSDLKTCSNEPHLKLESCKCIEQFIFDVSSENIYFRYADPDGNLASAYASWYVDYGNSWELLAKTQHSNDISSSWTCWAFSTTPSELEFLRTQNGYGETSVGDYKVEFKIDNGLKHIAYFTIDDPDADKYGTFSVTDPASFGMGKIFWNQDGITFGKIRLVYKINGVIEEEILDNMNDNIFLRAFPNTIDRDENNLFKQGIVDIYVENIFHSSLLYMVVECLKNSDCSEKSQQTHTQSWGDTCIDYKCNAGPTSALPLHCSNSKADYEKGELGIDCGPVCSLDCCKNNFFDPDLGEEGIDCGGQCLPCDYDEIYSDISDVVQLLEPATDSESLTSSTYYCYPGGSQDCREDELLFCDWEVASTSCGCTQKSSFWYEDEMVYGRFYTSDDINSRIKLFYKPKDGTSYIFITDEYYIRGVADTLAGSNYICYTFSLDISVLEQKCASYGGCPYGEWKAQIYKSDGSKVENFFTIEEPGTGYDIDFPYVADKQVYGPQGSLYIDDPAFTIYDIQSAIVYLNSTGGLLMVDVTSAVDNNIVTLPDGTTIRLDAGESAKIYYLNGLWIVVSDNAEVTPLQATITFPDGQSVTADESFNGSSIIIDQYGTACVILEPRTRYELRLQGQDPFAFYLPAGSPSFRLCIRKNPAQQFSFDFEACSSCGEIDILAPKSMINSIVEYEMPDMWLSIFSDVVSSGDINNKMSMSFSSGLSGIDRLLIKNDNLFSPTFIYNSFFEVLEKDNFRFARITGIEKRDLITFYETTNSENDIFFQDKDLVQQGSNKVILYGPNSGKMQDFEDELKGQYDYAVSFPD